MSAPARTLAAAGRRLELGDRPLVMGIVNATPDSFSDGGGIRTLEQRVELAREMLANAGALQGVHMQIHIRCLRPQPSDQLRDQARVIQIDTGDLYPRLQLRRIEYRLRECP